MPEKPAPITTASSSSTPAGPASSFFEGRDVTGGNRIRSSGCGSQRGSERLRDRQRDILGQRTGSLGAESLVELDAVLDADHYGVDVREPERVAQRDNCGGLPELGCELTKGPG